LNDDQSVSFQAGILDNVTGERSYSSQRLPQAGEASGRPAFAARTSWTRNINGKPFTFGTSGYYSRQNWGEGWIADGWAALGDWRVSRCWRIVCSGGVYIGEAAGGLRGGSAQPVPSSDKP